jgi:uncharacterized protein (DUF433 family)
MKHERSFLGIGLYTVDEASRLTRIPARTLRRWLSGRREGSDYHPPLWRGQIDLDDGQTWLGFRDLVQSRLTSSLAKAGLRTPKLRDAIEMASQILMTDHPFADGRFKTDGRNLLLQVVQPDGDSNTGKLIDLLRRGQYAMSNIVGPSLRDIEFDNDDKAVRWLWNGRRGRVVIDPARSFGAPIDAETGVPTRVLADAVSREGGAQVVAALFQVPLAAVQAAVRFENELSATNVEPAAA